MYVDVLKVLIKFQLKSITTFYKTLYAFVSWFLMIIIKQGWNTYLNSSSFSILPNKVDTTEAFLQLTSLTFWKVIAKLYGLFIEKNGERRNSNASIPLKLECFSHYLLNSANQIDEFNDGRYCDWSIASWIWLVCIGALWSSFQNIYSSLTP